MKKRAYFEWGVLDAMAVSDEWDAWRYDMREEMKALQDKDTFSECRDQNFGQTYLNHAAKILTGDGIVLVAELREKIKDHDAWLTFMQTLELVSLVNHAGEIPASSNMGKGHSLDQSIKAGKPRTRYGMTPEERAKRDAQILVEWEKNLSNKNVLSKNSFAEYWGKRYNLGPISIKKILEKSTTQS